jgi:hypothetical protein
LFFTSLFLFTQAIDLDAAFAKEAAVLHEAFAKEIEALQQHFDDLRAAGQNSDGDNLASE